MRTLSKPNPELEQVSRTYSAADLTAPSRSVPADGCPDEVKRGFAAPDGNLRGRLFHGTKEGPQADAPLLTAEPHGIRETCVGAHMLIFDRALFKRPAGSPLLYTVTHAVTHGVPQDVSPGEWLGFRPQLRSCRGAGVERRRHPDEAGYLPW